MVSAESRAAPRIESYVRDITPDLYGAFWIRRRIVAELTDHLLEAVHRFHEQGISWAEAEERAVDQFGSPGLVARTFAQSKGVGVPTSFTRYSGLAAIIGSLMAGIAFVVQELSVAFEQSYFGYISTIGGTLVAIALFGVYIRSRGQLGNYGRLGFRFAVGGFVVGMGSAMAWFMPGSFAGLIAMVVGLFLYLGAVIRSNIFPRWTVGSLFGGIAVSLVIGLFGSFLGLIGRGSDTGPLATSLGALIMTVGFVGIGRFLWSEKAVEQSEWTDPVSPA